MEKTIVTPPFLYVSRKSAQEAHPGERIVPIKYQDKEFYFSYEGPEHFRSIARRSEHCFGKVRREVEILQWPNGSLKSILRLRNSDNEGRWLTSCFYLYDKLEQAQGAMSGYFPKRKAG